MPQNDLVAKSAFLATQNEINKKLLLVGKFKNLRMPRGFLFYLFDFSEVDKKSAENFKVALENIYTECTDFDQSIEVIFEDIIERYNDALCDLARRKILIWDENFNALIGLVDKNELALSQTGNVSGYLFRNNKISALLDNSTESRSHPLKTFSSIMTGKLIENDKIVVASASFFNLISLDRIRNIFSTNPIRNSIEIIAKNFRLEKSSVNAVFLEIDSISADEDERPEKLFLDQKVETFHSMVFSSIKLMTKGFLNIAKKHLPIIARSIKRKVSSAYTLALPGVKRISQGLSAKSHSLAIKKFGNQNFSGFNGRIKYNNIQIKDFSNLKAGFRFTELIISQAKNVLRFSMTKENRKYLYGIGIILLTVFVLSNIGSKNKEKTEVKKSEQIVLSYDQANELFGEAKEIYASNKKAAIPKFQEALGLAEQAKESPNLREKSIVLIQQIRDLLDKEIKATRIDEGYSPLAFDQSITAITLVGSEIYGVNNGGKLYLFDTRDNESKLISGLNDEDGKPIALASSESLNKIYILTDKQKLAVYDIASGTINTLNAPDTQENWGTATQIAVFSSNLYLLDASSNMIWKHTEKDGVFLKASPYFNNKQISVKNAKSLAVDGSIYTILDNGAIMRLAQNTLDKEFTIKSIPAPDDKITTPSKIFTNEDTNELYILDSSLNRIVKADKSGTFASQYLFDKIKIDDFVINSKIQKIWIISNGMIYSLNL